MLAVRHVCNAHIDARAKADQIKRGFGGFAQRPGTHHGRPESKAVPKLRLGCQHDVLQCGEFIEYGSDLIGAGQSHAGTPINRDLCDIFSVKQDATLAWPGLARQLGNQGLFSGTVRADDGMRFSSFNAHVEMVGRQQAAITFDQIAHAQQIHGTLPFAGMDGSMSCSKPSMPRLVSSTMATISTPRIIIQWSVWLFNISSSRMRPMAPSKGPITLATPPSTTMMIKSPDMLHDIKDGKKNRVRLEYSMPATPHTMADST